MDRHELDDALGQYLEASTLAVILLALTLVGFAVYYRVMRLERLFEGLG